MEPVELTGQKGDTNAPTDDGVIVGDTNSNTGGVLHDGKLSVANV